MEQPQLRMVIPSLARLPEVALPAGYTIRTYEPGDGAAWCRLIEGECTEEQSEQEMNGAPGLEPDDVRLEAIRLYLALAFRPEITHDGHAERRRRVWRELALEGKEVGT